MNLTALQENILEAAKKNQPSYIIKNKYKFSKQDLDVQDSFKNTPLYYAVQNMHFDMVRILLSCGADANKRCELGNTPLH